MTRARFGATCAALLLLPAVALAAPVITGISPGLTPANTGATVHITGTGFGASNDVVQFPGNKKVSPTSSGSGYVDVRVPDTYSGNVLVQSHGTGSWSNGFNLDISYSKHGYWPAGTFGWSLCTTHVDSCTVDEFEGAALRAFSAWSCASGVAPVYQGRTVAQPVDGDGMNILFFVNSGWQDPNIIANTGWFNEAGTDDRILGFDIAMNQVHYTWSCNGSLTAMDVQGILTHEIGHAIGFWDQYGDFDRPETMYGSTGPANFGLRTLSEYDVEGAEALYPHAGRANLSAGHPSGWAADIVPRNAADAVYTSVLLPATLTGNSTSYLNVGATNSGFDCASPEAVHRLWVDDEWPWDLGWSGTWASGASGGWLNVPWRIRGGRHTVRELMDANGGIPESNEGDNTSQLQYVWSPYVIADQATVRRDPPPPQGALAVPNCDGFQFTANWWGAVGVLPTVEGDDYDVQVFEDYAGSQAGFATPMATSAASGTGSDFVIFNGNGLGTGFTRWAGVDRYNAGAGAPYVLSESNQVGATMDPSSTYGSGAPSVSASFTGDQVVKVHEVHLSDPNTTYEFKLTNTAGTADLNISLYGPSGHYYGKGDYVAHASASGPGGNESFTYRPGVAGYYGIAVWKKDADDVGRTGSYTLTVGAALSNLNAAVTPSGFASPIVPRNDATATVSSAPVSATLGGNTTTTFASWSTLQEGPNPMPAWATELYLDDSASWIARLATLNGNPPSAYNFMNAGPLAMRGGRHTLYSVADAAAAVAESNESDNVWTGQWVWSPLELARDTPVTRAAPPAYGTLPNPNSDGFAFSRTSGYAWAVAIAPLAAIDDYDLFCYDDYTGSTSGFSHPIAISASLAGWTEFVVGHYNGTPLRVYPAAMRYSGSGGSSFVVDADDANNRQGGIGTGQVVFNGQTLAPNRLVNVYEAYLFAGTTYGLLLQRSGGAADLMAAVYPGTTGGVYPRGAYVRATVGRGATDDTLTYQAVTTGWHPIVVFRSTGANVNETTQYALQWYPRAALDAGGPESWTLAFAGARPNPVTGATRFGFSLARAGHVRLTVLDLTGREVAVIADRDESPGHHDLPWDSGGLSPGLYWARLDAGGRTFARRVTILR